MPSNVENSWHLTKGVSVSTILVVLCNLLALVWGGAQLNARVSENSKALVRMDQLHAKEIQRVEQTLTSTTVRASDTHTRVIRIEEKIGAQHAILERIEKGLKR